MAKNTSYDSVLILGNGFDKNCGLKTSYTDVYQEYVTTPSSSATIQKFKNEIQNDFENWSDFEIGMAKYAQSLSSEAEIIECVTDFDYFIHEYLKRVQSEFFDEFSKLETNKNCITEFIDSIKTMGYGVSHNCDNLLTSLDIPNPFRLGCISFNYTEIFDRFLSYSNINYPGTIHVHGKLGDDPILGVDRESQLDLKFPISDNLKRSFIKPFFNDEYDSTRVRTAREMIESAKIIFVYGASLGESDLSWRELLGTWLQKDSNNHLFFYDYKNTSKTFRTAPERLNYELAQKRELLKDWKLDDKDQMLSQIHLPCGRNIFNVGDAMAKDEKESERIKKEKAAIKHPTIRINTEA